MPTPSIRRPRLIALLCVAASVTARSAMAQAVDSASIAARVADAVCAKDVVLLGELPTHGEARGFSLKASIVDRLVERCGFAAVLFEAPVYDFIGFDQAVQTKTATATQLDSAIGRFWSTRELAAWRRTLFERAARRRLTLGGIDDQVSVTSQYARATLPDLVAAASPASASAECRETVDRNLRWLYDDKRPFDGGEQERLQQCARNASNRSARTATQDSTMLANFAAYADRQRDPAAPSRDESMFRNTVWYLDHLPPGSKVIVWTASVHAARQRGDLGYVPLGALLSERLGDRMASVGFTALGGQTSMAGRPSKPLPDASAGSLEAVSMRSGAPYALLNRETLRAVGVVPSRLMGRATPMDLSSVFDIVVVVRDEVAPTFAR